MKPRSVYPFLPSFCTICRRSAFIGRGKPYIYYCQECSEMPRTSKPLDEWEKNALLAMDDAAGEYVARLATTDIAVWSDEHRMDLWKIALGAWQASMTEQANGVGAPF